MRKKFQISSKYKPAGDQPKAMTTLLEAGFAEEFAEMVKYDINMRSSIYLSSLLESAVLTDKSRFSFDNEMDVFRFQDERPQENLNFIKVQFDCKDMDEQRIRALRKFCKLAKNINAESLGSQGRSNGQNQHNRQYSGNRF